jgi:hypothetical protein
MIDESAAGRKTDQSRDRAERVAAGLEKHFNDCGHVLRDLMGRAPITESIAPAI